MVSVALAIKANQEITVQSQPADNEVTSNAPDEAIGIYVIIAVWAILTAIRILAAAIRTTSVLRSQSDARSAMFDLLSRLNAELKWLSILMFLLTASIIVTLLLLGGVALTSG